MKTCYTLDAERSRSAARDKGLSITPDFIASPLHRLVRRIFILAVHSRLLLRVACKLRPSHLAEQYCTISGLFSGREKARLLDLYRQNILREIIEPGFVNPFAVLSWAVELPTNLTHTGFDRPITY
jgi:hypothetical protein